MNLTAPWILIRGGGDLASGVALRLHQARYPVVMIEVAQPLAVRRAVSFSEAVYLGRWEIEGVVAKLVKSDEALKETLLAGMVPVLVDPAAAILDRISPQALVDARMLKRPPELAHPAASLVVGLGPGFTAGEDCHAVVETSRGHQMGRLYWQGCAQENTGIPEPVAGYDVQRVIRAPMDGVLVSGLPIGSILQPSERIVSVGETSILAGFRGALRGLLHDGVTVEKGQKIGDLDPRADADYCFTVSDKALAMGGAVLEALLVRGFFPQDATQWS